MMRKLKYLLIATALMVVAVPVLAQSTSKSFSTNFTLVNLESGLAQGQVQYVRPDGSAWRADESFSLDGMGAQAIFRQYMDGPGFIADAGRGSVVVSADKQLGAVVQVLARDQSPTSSGAYSGMSAGDSSFFVPLVAKNLGTASGTGNSQIIVQNTSSSDSVVVDIDLVGPTGSVVYTREDATIAANASFEYDLATESDANLPGNWFGSAVVRVDGTGEVAVVSNFYTGDAMQTFNAFGASAPGTRWYVPLFTSRLPNSLSTPIAVQNLSGTTIAANQLTATCTPDPGLSGASAFTLRNSTQILDTAAYYFNPVTDSTIPEGWYGSCVVEAPADVVVFVQMRFVDTGEAAAYEGIRAGGTDTTAIVPLVAKRLANGFATAVTIQNLSSSNATVDLIYTPSDGGTAITIPDVVIPGNQSLIQNQRIPSGVTQLPDNWVGTLVVESNQPVAAFVQLTFLRDINPNLPQGDNFMAHNAFTVLPAQ